MVFRVQNFRVQGLGLLTVEGSGFRDHFCFCKSEGFAGAAYDEG